MENATKALLIIGEILIGMIILSIMVILFSRMGEISQSLSSKAENREMVMFNTEYQKFEAQPGMDKEYLTPEEVITLINKVHSWNMSTEDETEEIYLAVNGTEVVVNKDNLELRDKDDLIEFLKENKKYELVYSKLERIKSKDLSDDELKNLKDTKFTCKITYNGDKGRVDTITIETITD